MVQFLGFNISRSDKKQTKELTTTFSQPSNPDAAVEISSAASGFISYGLNTDTTVKTENQLITQYRDLSIQPEFETAIDHIVNEAFTISEDEAPVKINLDQVDGVSSKVKNEIVKEFDGVIRLLNFKNDAYEIFKRWYVDGRLNYHKVIDESNTKRGIIELRYIDPRKIKKVREQILQKDRLTQVPAALSSEVNVKYIEYYLYNSRGVDSSTMQGVKIAPDAITFVHSGLMDKTNSMILSYLHKAIQPFNQLRMMEDTTLIYRVSRAPERRIFNFEVGNLPKLKAEQYVTEQIRRFKNKMVYDPTTGELKNDVKYVTMLEDFYFPKRDGKGTTIETLPAGQGLGDMDEVDHFKKKLYESLGVPLSRLDPTTQFSLGRSSEITREEIKFAKFITRLRRRFSKLFEDILGTQLVLKNILSLEEWNLIKDDVYFDFIQDNMFAELKETEIWTNRLAVYRDAKDLVEDRIISKAWVRREILKISDTEYEEMKKEIEAEREEDQDEDLEGGDANNSEIPDGQDIDFNGDEEVPQREPRPTPFKSETVEEEHSYLTEWLTKRRSAK